MHRENFIFYLYLVQQKHKNERIMHKAQHCLFHVLKLFFVYIVSSKVILFLHFWPHFVSMNLRFCWHSRTKFKYLWLTDIYRTRVERRWRTHGAESNHQRSHAVRFSNNSWRHPLYSGQSDAGQARGISVVTAVCAVLCACGRNMDRSTTLNRNASKNIPRDKPTLILV